MKKLITEFNKYIDLNEDEIAFINNNSNEIDFPKNHILLKEGQTSKAFYFIVKGCLRLYYVSNGEEKCAYFYTESMFVSSFLSFTKQMPSNHYIATIEKSTLIKFDLATVDRFIKFSPKFGILVKIMMERELSTYQQIISSFITKNAEERYLEFIKTHSDLKQRIPQHFIATYIGVSPETLSRIRKRILRK